MTLEELFTYQNLYRSYLKSRKGKRHKDEVILFGLNLEENLLTIENDLIKGTYQFDGYKSFKIYEPKERLVEYISFKDRIVQHCLVDYYLTPLLERHLIFDNASCRKKKGTDYRSRSAARTRASSLRIRRVAIRLNTKLISGIDAHKVGYHSAPVSTTPSIGS